MRTVSEVYEEYQIPPWLQLHQLRVAAVGKFICEARQDADMRTVVLTGLFHDMGNILKFDLSATGPLASFLGTDAAHWQEVKDGFAKTYGADEHEATIAIARKIKMPDPVIRLIRGISFSQMERIKDEGPLELQICEYADMRVGPFGILPLHERVADLKNRSRRRWAEGYAKDMEAKFDHSTALLGDIEQHLFANISIQPEDVTDEAVTPVIDALKQYEV